MPSLAPIKVPIVGVDEYTKSFNKMTQNMKKMGQAITSTGRTLTSALTLPIVGVGVAGLKMSKDFNKAMASVGSLIPGQSDRLQKLKKDVMGLGAETGKSSEVIAEGLYETISAFGDAQDPINKLRTATQMSVAGMSTVKEALSLVSAVTKGYGDTSDEAAKKVSDLSFLTVKLGQTTFPELASSIGKVVPLATTLGIKQQELFAGFATLTGVTGGAAEVATQLESALGGFIKPSVAMTKQAKKLGYESSVLMVKELGLMGALEKLQEVTKGDEIAMGKLLTRKEGLNAALTLLGPQADSFTEKLEAMGNAVGSTMEAYREQTNGINKAGFAFDRFAEKVKIAAIRVGDKLAPVLLKLMERIEPLVNKITNMSDETLEMGIKVAGAVALIGPALIVIGKLTTGIAGLVSLVGGAGGLGAVFAVLTGPIGLTVAAITAATAAVVYFWDELKPLREAIVIPFIDAFKDLSSIFTASSKNTNGMTEALKRLVSAVSKLLAPVGSLAAKLLLLPLRIMIKQVKASLVVWEKLGQVFNVVFKTAEYGVLWLSNLWTEFKEGTTVGKLLASVFETIGSAVDYVWDKISSLWKTVTDFLNIDVDFLGGMNESLDEAIAKQKQIAEAQQFGGLEYTSTTEGYNQTILDSIATGRGETTVNISMEQTPEGVKVKAVDSKGRSAKVNGPQGDIIGGTV